MPDADALARRETLQKLTRPEVLLLYEPLGEGHAIVCQQIDAPNLVRETQGGKVAAALQVPAAVDGVQR